ncbi:acyltransferase [bacterium]|nr:acyltransferase [bacterium]
MLPTYEQFRATKSFNSLDGLRGLAIISVVWHHTAGHFMPSGTLPGYISVYVFHLFFIISGFLITTLLLREREKHGRMSLKNFHIRRSLRIYPLYYTVIVLYIIAVKLVEPNSVYGLQYMSNLKYFLTYTSNWFVTLDMINNRVIFYFAWALATEMQFYLVWPLIEKYLSRFWPVLLAILLIVVREAADNGLLDDTFAGGFLTLKIILSTSEGLCLGVITAHLLHSERGFNSVRRYLGQAWMPLIAVIVLMTFIILLNVTTPLNTLFIILLLTITMISCAIREDHWLKGVLASPIARFVGKVSYGVYLMHMLTYNVIKKVLPAALLDNLVLVFVISLIVVIFVAWLSYRYYESFFLRIKARYSRTA